MTEPRVQAVIFDWAGTIVDYGCFAPVAGMAQLFRIRDIPIDAAEVRPDMGLAKGDHIRKLLAIPHIHEAWLERYAAPPEERDVQKLVIELENNLQAAMQTHSAPIPGALETVSQLRRRNIRIGSSTGYTQRIMDVVVPAAKSYGYEPDAVVTSSDVPVGRPSPYMCYANAIQLEAFPLWQMVKVGDTTADILEGQNAGMWTIAVVKGSNDLGMSLQEVETTDVAILEKRIQLVKARFAALGSDYVVDDISTLPEVIDAIAQRLAKGEMPSAVRSLAQHGR